MPGYAENEEIVRTRRKSSMARKALIPRDPSDPNDSVDELYIRRRQDSTDSYHPRARSVDYREEEYRRPDRIVQVSQRRYSNYSDEGRVRRYSNDSDSLSPRSHSRHSRHSRRSSRSPRRPSSLAPPAVVPCSANCPDHPAPDLESDFEAYSSEEENEKARKLRNKELLAGGLATITTIAAANNVYQSFQGSKARREKVARGQLCAAGARTEKQKAIVMDLVSVGIAAVCLNNARNGWKKLEVQKGERERHYLRHQEKREFHQAQKLIEGPGEFGRPVQGLTWNGSQTVDWDGRGRVEVR